VSLNNILDIPLSAVAWSVRYLEMENRTLVVCVAELRKHATFIATEDLTWILVRNGKRHPWIFHDALEVLKKLPSNPADYVPYQDFITTRQPVA